MSRIRTNLITNRMANGAPTVSHGLVISGVTTVTTLDLNGDIDVDGHTNLDNVNIAGVSTFAGAIDLNADLDVDGHLNVDNVNVVGVTTFNNRIEIDDNTIRDNISAGNNLGIMFSSAGGGAISPTAGNGTLVNGLKDFGENSYRWRNGYFTTLYGDGSNLTGITGTTINNNADNRVITGSGTANTLEGESQLLFTGTNLGVGNRTSSPDERLHVHTSSGQANIHVEGATDGQIILRAHSGDSVIHLGDASATSVGKILYDHGTDSLQFNTNSNERLRIASDGNFGFNTSSPSAYALATFNSANGIQLQGDSQSRILMRNNTGGTNEKMMDIQCNGNINFRTINDDYTTATTRATFRTDGNFVVGNRVGTSSPSTNQPVAFHSARITPDTMTSTVSNGVRCNLYVGSNSGWQAGDGGVIGLGGSRAGYAGQEAIWSYIKGSRQSGNGWEYAGKMELGTTEWGTYNMTKAVTIFADNQMRLHGDDNTMMTFDIGGATRLVIEHTGGGNMRLKNASSGTVTYTTSSDYRLKENVVGISSALTTVKALKPYEYKWKHDGKLGQGFFAHEAQEVLPDVGIVSGTKDEVQTEDDTKHDGQWKKDDPIYQSIDYAKLVPLLTAALQEETAKREALEARVAALEGS